MNIDELGAARQGWTVVATVWEAPPKGELYFMLDMICPECKDEVRLRPYYDDHSHCSCSIWTIRPYDDAEGQKYRIYREEVEIE